MYPFPSVVSADFKQEYDGSLHPHACRIPSPSLSAWSSSHTSSVWSDRHDTPWSSPNMHMACSPKPVYLDTIPLAYPNPEGFEEGEMAAKSSCVAMHDVQHYADTPAERQNYEEEQTAYSYSLIQEGYQTIEHVRTPDSDQATLLSDEPSNAQPQCEQPHIRRRRAQAPRSITSPHLPSKVAKRGSTTKRPSFSHGRSLSDTIAVSTSSDRAFLCPLAPYGCTSTFGSKNEWKRHVSTQHLRLGYWRCDQCPSHDRKPNDFNRKDLFIQHVRRMHPVGGTNQPQDRKNTRAKGGKGDATDDMLDHVSQRCYKRLREPPAQSCCLFCDEKFTGESSWDERMEHVGRHMESLRKDGSPAGTQPSQWRDDGLSQAYLIAEGLIVRHGKGWILADRKP
ncbi:hypothetical protein K431DRAFT_220571 [Polychaeton citri CBS 116435]|uniref:C2H2-type domain-containing protein n=1 Tax=Polychaeton citri CBS 116435 TaxID=1314669 RepID=A0A9P4URZ3_9PEZI|nr:hypothetical protein K431DRAFT_220571 [Polychaeton citri CBS 116435]